MSTDRNKAFLNAMKEVSAHFKDTPIGTINTLRQMNVETISTGSLILDSILGGGAPKGRVIEIFGSEASGKTSIALTLLANVQKQGGNGVFLDVEQAFDPKYAKSLGVDLEKLGFAQPLIAEDVLNMVKNLCKTGTVDIIVIDSLASMVPRAEAEQELGKSTIGLLARLLSQALKQITGVASTNNCTIVLLNQVRDKIGVSYGPSYDTTGGRATKFYASQRIEVKRRGKIEDDGEIVGNEIFMRCVKNKVAPPYGEGTTVLTFAKGINRAAELLVLGEQEKVIEKIGRTYFYKPIRPVTQEEIGGYSSKLEQDGRIKLAVNAKPVLRELEENRAVYNMIADEVVYILKKKQGLLTEEEVKEYVE